MKNFILTRQKNKSQFTVAVNQINNSRALLPNVLYKKMEDFAINLVHPFQYNSVSIPKLQKLNILKNAFLNDILKVKSRILKLDEIELQLLIEVYRELNDGDDTICEALFSFDLQEKSVDQAS